MRLTIERIRTLIVLAGVLLIVAIGGFLGFSKWRHKFIGRDIPQRLGVNIQQEANGVTYTQAHGGHTIFKIHASRVVQLRNQHATLHDVVIELYGKNGQRVDRIQGAEFEYDQKTSIATASGTVEIEMQRPVRGSGQAGNAKDAIRVKTSGITFNQATGIVTTNERVEFTTERGSGSATGASYDSDLGALTLNRDVELNTARGGESVSVRAAHAEFNRDTQTGLLRQATAQSRGEEASATEAHINFRDDGSVERLSASSGFTVSTHNGSRMAAPTGHLEFTERNTPSRAHLEGGVNIDSNSGGRTVHGTSPMMDLDFTPAGDLRHAHMERGVEMQTQETQIAASATTQLIRTWHSPVADIDFRNSARGQVEPAVLHGTQGVVITTESRRAGAAPAPSRLAADDLVAQFGPGATITSVTGVGHAVLDQSAANGARQTATGDRLEAKFNSAVQSLAPRQAGAATASQIDQLQTAQLLGNVVLTQQAAATAGSRPPIRATAGRAVYDSAGTVAASDRWLHLSDHPRINDGNSDISADQIDIAQSSGDAYARGNVKATWVNEKASAQNSGATAAVFLGGTAPAHVIAAEAAIHQSTGEGVFRGHARLWEDQNSISAPVITLNRNQQSLVAQSAGPNDPVQAVLLTAEGATRGAKSANDSRAVSVVRVRSGDLRYSGQDRNAVLHAAPLASVTAQTGAVQTASDQLELYLAAPNAAHASQPATQGQIEKIVALGHVSVTSQGRRGTGSQLVYTAQTGTYVLTGTPSAPPRMTDPQRGSITGESLLFNSHDDSVSIEGGSQPSTTQTTVPR